MKMRGASEGADFAVAEAAGNRKLWKDIASDAHIAIGAAKPVSYTHLTLPTKA